MQHISGDMVDRLFFGYVLRLLSDHKCQSDLPIDFVRIYLLPAFEDVRGAAGFFVLGIRKYDALPRLGAAQLVSYTIGEWTLNALLTKSSSLRKCSKRRISGHSAQAISRLRIEGMMNCWPAARGSSCGRILVSAAGLSLQCFDCPKPTARITSAATPP